MVATQRGEPRTYGLSANNPVVDAQEKSGGESGGHAPWHAMAVAWLGEMFDAMDATIYFIVLFPALSELLHTKDASAIGWHGGLILAMFMVGWSLGSVFFGMIADRFGRMRALVSSILLYAFCTALCAFASSWIELGICRFLVGIGIGGNIGLATVVVSEHWRGRGRLWTICILGTSFSAGCFLTGGFNSLFGELGWRPLFLVGIIPALLTLYIRLTLKESRQYEEDVQANLVETGEKPRPLAIMQELMTGENRRNLIVCASLAGAAIVGYWAAISWIPAWINTLTGELAVSERSAAMNWLSFGGLTSSLLTPFAVMRLGRAGTLKLGFGLSLLATVLMFLTVQHYSYELLAWNFAVGFACYPPFHIAGLYSVEVFAPRVMGTASGITWGAGRLVAAMAGLCSGPLIMAFGGSYALAGATVAAVVYSLGFAASFFVTEPYSFSEEEECSLPGLVRTI
ncbi:MAG: MFS transporter [Candidatus Obscuribacterales bacterium]|nr:MFS transporter [Candidatus Obscuribacterales bacterium]